MAKQQKALTLFLGNGQPVQLFTNPPDGVAGAGGGLGQVSPFAQEMMDVVGGSGDPPAAVENQQNQSVIHASRAHVVDEEWWTKPRGEKTGGSGLDAVHVEALDAWRFRNELDRQRTITELQYPGSKQRQHAAEGSNPGDPELNLTAGAASYKNVIEWISDAGYTIGEWGVDLVSVIDQWNIYADQGK
jgi:hypothetical protein